MEPLTTFQLYDYVFQDSILKDCFLGIFAQDQLPANALDFDFKALDYNAKLRPACLIANLDPSNQPGSHWTCVFVNEQDECTYFDSFGLPPIDEPLEELCEQLDSKYAFNNKKLQHFSSSTCGLYVIYTLKCLARKISLNSIVEDFSSNKMQNDKTIVEKINELN